MTAARQLARWALVTVAVCIILWQVTRHYAGGAMSATWMLVVLLLIVVEFAMSE